MRRLALVAIIALAGACSGPSVSPIASAASQAELWCPAAALADCRAAVEAAARVSLPSAVCTFNDGKWAVTTPKMGDSPGSACGPDGSGTIRGIIVAP